MLPAISPDEARQKLAAGQARLVDIREPDEIKLARIDGAEAAPLSVLPLMHLAPASDALPIIFTCHSGRRTSKASDLLQQAANGPAWQLDGGVSAWLSQGLPVLRSRKRLSIFRQIQIGAGSLVLLGLAGALLWPSMIWISALGGAGLIFAGVTGFCGLGLLLAAMPWNKD